MSSSFSSDGDSVLSMESSDYDQTETIIEIDDRRDVVENLKTTSSFLLFVLILSGIVVVVLCFILSYSLIWGQNIESTLDLSSLRSRIRKELQSLDFSMSSYNVDSRSSEERKLGIVYSDDDKTTLQNFGSKGDFYHCHGFCQGSSVDYFLAQNPGIYESNLERARSAIQEDGVYDVNDVGIARLLEVEVLKFMYHIIDQSDEVCFSIINGVDPIDKFRNAREAERFMEEKNYEFCRKAVVLKSPDEEKKQITSICKPFYSECRPVSEGCWNGNLHTDKSQKMMSKKWESPDERQSNHQQQQQWNNNQRGNRRPRNNGNRGRNLERGEDGSFSLE